MPVYRSPRKSAGNDKGKEKARPKKHLKDNTDPCEICGVVISRKSDIPRHAKTHGPDDEKLTCPWAGCGHKTWQKSNMNTHIRSQHTKEKTSICSQCNFKTSDPSSLLRHRKRLHAFIPSPRHSRSVGYTKSNTMHVPIRVMSSEPQDLLAHANSATQRIPTSSLCSYGQDSETYRPFYGSEEYGTSRNLNVAGEDDMGQSIANDASKLLLVASNGVNEIFRHSYGQALAPVLPSSSQVFIDESTDYQNWSRCLSTVYPDLNGSVYHSGAFIPIQSTPQSRQLVGSGGGISTAYLNSNDSSTSTQYGTALDIGATGSYSFNLASWYSDYVMTQAFIPPT